MSKLLKKIGLNSRKALNSSISPKKKNKVLKDFVKLIEINKNKIINNFEKINNISFNFKQTINDKIEEGNCIIQYPKKINCVLQLGKPYTFSSLQLQLPCTQNAPQTRV